MLSHSFFSGVCRKDHKESEFAVNEVYALDIFASTGEGKVRAVFA